MAASWALSLSDIPPSPAAPQVPALARTPTPARQLRQQMDQSDKKVAHTPYLGLRLTLTDQTVTMVAWLGTPSTGAPRARGATGLRLGGRSHGRHDRRDPAGAHHERNAAGGAGA